MRPERNLARAPHTRRLRWLAAALLVCACGCTERDVTSVENGLWQMFTGHDKPIILEPPPPPVYCYKTIGRAQCESEPIAPDRKAAIR